MSLILPRSEVMFQSPIIHHRAALPSRRYHHRAWKRRRFKPLTIHNQFNPFDNLFHSLISQFPSANYIAPTLGLATGLAIYFSSTKSPKLISNPKNTRDSNPDLGDWILFSTPTPFNRFVTLRCPSICFAGGELLEDVNERLVREEKHYVTLNTGRIVKGNSDDEFDGKLAYQRICIGLEDGGVLSLDWPANLELEEERGLDTTVLIFPGTTEGSGERKIRGFVCECLRRGVFPVVMNPRGCAGSPLTTARLFTAGDSDDIAAAVQFIHKRRPWTTIMGVGWGYGANMLTKYLAECGDKTPLTAATCIDNPFDLEEATRSTMREMDSDQGLVGGMIDILQGNKELFQGRGKGFDVEKAMSASSIRDFDQAISMVSYGDDTVEEFYAKSSSRDVIGEVKIPLLFIQNDDGTVPPFSIPRSLIEDNPYTSLLLCTYSPSHRSGRRAFSWCQNLTIEWLTAVELGLLKGRHPLLEDVDVIINPSRGLSLVDGRASTKSNEKDKLFNFPNGNSVNTPRKMLEANSIASTRDKGGLHNEEEEHQNEEVDSLHNERGQVLQSAQVVMNMLDVTMPDTLLEEQKKKVLQAVGKGEMLMNALQDAVPEDVREKLTGTVSEILQSRGTNLEFDKLLSLGHFPDVTSGLNSEVLEKISLSRAKGVEDVHSSDKKKTTNDSEDGSGTVHHSSENVESKNQSSEISENQNDPDLEKGDPKDVENNSENEQFLKTNTSEEFDDVENMSKISISQEENKHDDDSTDQNKVTDASHTENNSETPQLEENEAEKNQEKEDGNETENTQKKEEENESENNQKKEEKELQPVSNQSNSSPPSFNVTQAFEALTGLDDSTQVAVNSVFNVIEGMIDQLEVKKENENEVKEDDHNSKKSETTEKSGLNNIVEGFEIGKKNETGVTSAGEFLKANFPSYLPTLPYKDPLYKEYLRSCLKARILSGVTNAMSLDLDTKLALYLDYIPEDNKWNSRFNYNNNNIIEPSYVILDSEEQKQPKSDRKLDESTLFIKNVILECLNVEVNRRVGAADVEELGLRLDRDIEHVANVVSRAAAMHRRDHKFLHGENIVTTISSAVQETQYLRRVLAVGVIVGSSLAALRKFFDVSALEDSNEEKDVDLCPEIEDEGDFDPSISDSEDKVDSSNGNVMVGAITAAIGASALLAHQQNTEAAGTLIDPLDEEKNVEEPSNLEDTSKKSHNNLVTSLAEKAMSVASPVVPTTEDGKVDQERLVTMLTELGQKGGILRLVGKVALLWGGMRGAMSLTDKLISYLQIAERPLIQRILGFVFMVLLVWSPVIVPLSPSLMRSWATHNPFKIFEFACIAGLYVSIMIMVMLWGKRIRKYEDPLQQYGLDLTSKSKFQNFLKGLAGGAMLVILIHFVKSSLGCVHLIWPTSLCLSSSSKADTLMKSYGWMLMMIVQSLATAIGVSIVEELLFRSWLPQEIAADLGYHHGIIISGLAFSVFQRSVWEVPALWFLSLSLSGARERNHGSLSLPVGIRTGILATNFILKTGGFLTNGSNFPKWVSGGQPVQPFSGVVGLAFSLVLAIVMYPQKPVSAKKITRVIKD